MYTTALIDAVRSSLINSKRMAPAPNLLRLVQEAVAGGKRGSAEAKGQFRAGRWYVGEHQKRQGVENEGPVFKNPVMRWAEGRVWWINQYPDQVMYRAAEAVNTYLLHKVYQGTRLKGITPADIQQQAQIQAEKWALRDKNFVSTTLELMKRNLNAMTALPFHFLSEEFKDDPVKAYAKLMRETEYGLGDHVIKFTQFPGATLKRLLEYSPVGLLDVAHEIGMLDWAKKTGKKRDSKFRTLNAQRALARVINGTGAGIGLGFAFGALGIMTPHDSEDKEERELNKEEGIQPYALNWSALQRLWRYNFNPIDYYAAGGDKYQNGDTLTRIDLLQPWSMLLAAGANIQHNATEAWKEAGARGVAQKAPGITAKAATAAYESVAGFVDVLEDATVLENFKRYYDSPQSSLKQAFLYTIQDMPRSFVPSAVRGMARVVDTTERDPRDRESGKLKSFFNEMFLRKPASAIPGLSQMLPPRLGTFGQEIKADRTARAANVLTGAPIPSTIQTKPISNAMRQAGKVAGAPRFQRESEKGPGETPAQWRERTQVKGQLLEKAGNAMAESYAYKQAPAEIQKRMTEVFLKRLSGGGSLHPGSIHSEARSQSLKEAREKVLGISSPQETLKQQKRMLNRFQ